MLKIATWHIPNTNTLSRSPDTSSWQKVTFLFGVQCEWGKKIFNRRMLQYNVYHNRTWNVYLYFWMVLFVLNCASMKMATRTTSTMAMKRMNASNVTFHNQENWNDEEQMMIGGIDNNTARVKTRSRSNRERDSQPRGNKKENTHVKLTSRWSCQQSNRHYHDISSLGKLYELTLLTHHTYCSYLPVSEWVCMYVYWKTTWQVPHWFWNILFKMLFFPWMWFSMG